MRNAMDIIVIAVALYAAPVWTASNEPIMITADQAGNVVLKTAAEGDLLVHTPPNAPKSFNSVLSELGSIQTMLYGRSARSGDSIVGKGEGEDSDEDTPSLIGVLGQQLEQLIALNDNPSGANLVEMRCPGITASGQCNVVNGANNVIRFIGRSFIQNPADVYTCAFTISKSVGTGKVITVDVVGDTKFGTLIECKVPAFASDQVPSNPFDVKVALFEGHGVPVPFIGSDSAHMGAVFSASGPAITFIPDVGLNTALQRKAVPFQISDPDSTPKQLKITFTSSNLEVVAENGLIYDAEAGELNVISKTGTKEGTTTITIFAEDQHKLNTTRSFVVTFTLFYKSCKAVKAAIPDAKDGTYKIKMDGWTEEKDMHCVFTGTDAWTICGKYKWTGASRHCLRDPFARADYNAKSLSDPWNWGTATGEKYQASTDCRQLIKDAGATHVLSRCYSTTAGSKSRFERVNNLFKETLGDATNLWDIKKEESGSRRLVDNKMHTWTVTYDDKSVSYKDLGSRDGRANLCEREGQVNQYKSNWMNHLREGALWSNAGNGNGGGTCSDTVFWGWRGHRGQCPSYGNAQSAGESITIGTPAGVASVQSNRNKMCAISVMYFGNPDLPTY